MEGQVRITPEIMRMRALEYSNQALALEDIIKAMNDLLIALQDEWEGAASTAYALKFESLKPGFVAAKDLINDIATALGNVATRLEETDNEIAAGFAG